MGKKTRPNRITICLIAAAVVGSLTIHGFDVTTFSARPKSLVETNPNTSNRNSQSQREFSSTVVYSKSKDVPAGDFKDINIDDVLFEAESALNAAQSSLVDSGAKDTEIKADFKDINIDDVLLEAENALSAAQTSLGDDNGATKPNGDDLETLKDKLRASVLSGDSEGKASVEVTEILSSTLGGILLGSVLGSVVAFQLSDLGLLSIGSESFSADILQFAAPTIAGVVLGGITGFAGSLQDNALGIIVRNVLGVPTKALASAIVGSIQEAVRRQVEKTTNEIKSIPSNVANSAKQTAVQKAKEAKLSVDLAIESLLEKLKQLVVVVAVLSSLVAVGFYVTNGEIFPAELLQFEISNLEIPSLKF